MVAALLALVLTTAAAEARGFGRVYGVGIAPRVGAWGRPVGPVRSGYGWRGGPTSFAYRNPHFHRHWHGGYWGYGLGGLGLGLGLGGLFGAYGYPVVDDDYVYGPPVEIAPVEVQIDVPVETEISPDLSAAIAACARRFRTYDPATQTYVGKGHVRRRCP